MKYIYVILEHSTKMGQQMLPEHFILEHLQNLKKNALQEF